MFERQKHLKLSIQTIMCVQRVWREAGKQKMEKCVQFQIIINDVFIRQFSSQSAQLI